MSRKKFFNLLIKTIVLSLILANVSPHLTKAAESEELDVNAYLVDYTEDSEGFDWNIYMDDTDESDSIESDIPEFQTYALPLVPIAIAVVVRLVTKWVGKQAVKKISKHAAERAAERGITARQFASAMSYGTKYVDKNTGAKILYHSPTKTTLVLDKAGKTVVTSYKQNKPKAVWKKKKW
ncbi:hypothetical protein P4571_06775 [Niallia alba]|uniref:hypothetical protein n=1 Tax=Niallia alba TaxID=2729105 RepID=UPI002E2294A8|nr:hypothetical protein [Niallia alba]